MAAIRLHSYFLSYICIEQIYFTYLLLLYLGQDYIIPPPADLLVTFEGGSDVTVLTVPVVLIDDDLDEQDLQEFQVRLEVVTAVNSSLLNLQPEFTGLIQDDDSMWVLPMY